MGNIVTNKYDNLIYAINIINIIWMIYNFQIDFSGWIITRTSGKFLKHILRGLGNILKVCHQYWIWIHLLQIHLHRFETHRWCYGWETWFASPLKGTDRDLTIFIVNICSLFCETVREHHIIICLSLKMTS